MHLLKTYSNTPELLVDLQECQRQLDKVAAEPGTESRRSVRNERRTAPKLPTVNERFTPTQLARIVREAQSHTVTYAAIAKRYGISVSSVKRLVSRHKRLNGSS